MFKIYCEVYDENFISNYFFIIYIITVALKIMIIQVTILSELYTKLATHLHLKLNCLSLKLKFILKQMQGKIMLGLHAVS